jgi:hypothetical protein
MSVHSILDILTPLYFIKKEESFLVVLVPIEVKTGLDSCLIIHISNNQNYYSKWDYRNSELWSHFQQKISNLCELSSRSISPNSQWEFDDFAVTLLSSQTAFLRVQIKLF